MLLLFIGLNIPATQRYIGKRVTSFLVKKTNKEVRIGQVGLNIWAELALKDVYVPDNNNDTLVSFEYVAVDIHLWDLFHNTIHLEEVTAENLSFHIFKNEQDSLYNFNYLITAFSGPDTSTTQQDTSSSSGGGGQFLIDEVQLESVRGDYADAVSGLYFQGDIGTLEATADEFDLDKQKIFLDEVQLKNTTWGLEQRKLSPEDTTSNEPSQWLIAVEELIIEQTKGHYISPPSGMYLYPDINYLLATKVKADVSAMDYSAEELVLKENDIKYYVGKTVSDSTQSSEVDSASTSTPWHVSAASIELQDNHLIYFDSTITKLPDHQFDPSHLNVNHLTIQLNDLDISPTFVDAQLENFAFALSEQMAVKSFSGQFHLDSTHLNLTDQHLETNHTQLDYTLKTTFKSLSDFLDSPENAFINEFKVDGKIGRSDVDYFYPLEEVPASIQTIAINTALKGKVNDLTLSTFKLESENHLKVDISGKIAGLPEVDELSYDLKINKLMTNLPALRATAQKQVATSVELPSWIDFRGTLEGTIQSVDAELKMKSQMGSADINADVNIEKGNEHYDVAISAEELAVGKLTGQDSLLGKTTFNFSAKGHYFDPNKIDATANLELKKLEVGKHVITDGKVSATWKNKQLTSNIQVHENYLDFVIKTAGEWENESLTTSNDITINELDFIEFNLSEESIELKTTFNLVTKGMSLEDFSAKTDIKKGNIVHESGYYSFAPATINLLLKKESSSIVLESPIVNVDFESSFNIEKMPDVMKHQFSHYFEMSDSVILKEHDGNEFTFSLEIVNERIFEEVLIPGLEEIKINTIKGSYTSSTHNLMLNADILHLKYNDILVDSMTFDMSSDINTLSAKLNASQLKAAGYTFFYPKVVAEATNNELNIAVQLANEQKEEKFGIEGVLKKIEQGYSWHLLEDGLMLYYEPWKVSPNNELIYLTDKNLEVNNFKISHGNQSITANNTQEKGAKIDFNNFTIENLSAIVFSDDQLIAGRINGSLFVDVQPGNVALSSDISIKHFAYAGDTLGNIDLKVTNPETGTYKSTFEISGNNQLNGNISYVMDTDDINGQLDLKQLNLATVESYAGGAVKDLSGSAKGNVSVSGKLNKPDFKGQLTLNDASFHLNAVNNTYKVEKSKLNFSQSELILETLQLKDKKGNKATVNGSVSLENFFPNKLNIDVSTKEFPILNTKPSDELFYGNVAMTSKIHIRGTYELPEIEAKLSLTPGSDFTIVVPEEEVQTESYEDVVEFVDFSSPSKPIEQQVVETAKSEILGIQLNARIEINPDVTLRLIIDPIAGDYLEIRGDAYLTYELNTGGGMKLTGLYTVKEGHYQMTYYNIIKRRFSIQEGSTVTWSGDPYNARVNIKAEYSTKASPLPLVQLQASETEKNALRKSIPVDVILHVTGEMLSPELDFNIELPTFNGSGLTGKVKTKLERLKESESEMNKQVFSLLILNRFIPEDPSQNTASSSLSSSARGSVSQLISDQFNALAGNYIKAVNINFNLDSYTDYSSGTAQGKTDLEIELSKAIFNDRLIVSVGSDFNVEGNDQQQQQQNVNSFVGDVRAEYLLTEDGKYRVKVYRENEYAGVIDGNLTKTGFAFILTEEFETVFRIKDKYEIEEKYKKKDEKK